MSNVQQLTTTTDAFDRVTKRLQGAALAVIVATLWIEKIRQPVNEIIGG